MSWDDIYGQSIVKEAFQTHLTSGRVPNAYLIVGPEGVGKRRLALEMAKALNCTAEANQPCDSCRTCGQIARGTHPDVHLLTPGGASEQVKIDQIRHVLSRVALRPFSARFQAVVLESAERLTEEAANALLKTLEEPSAHTCFLLTTAQLSDCVPTIVSRCQILRAHPLASEVVERIVLAQAPELNPAAARTVARLSQGSASLALALAAQWENYEKRLSTLAKPAANAGLRSSGQPESRQEVAELLEGMMRWLRDVAFSAAGAGQWVIHEPQKAMLAQQAGQVDLDRCLEAADSLISLRESVDQYVSPRLVASIAREKWLSLFSQATNSA